MYLTLARLWPVLLLVTYSSAVVVTSTQGPASDAIVIATHQEVMKATPATIILPAETNTITTIPKFVPSPVITLAPLSAGALVGRQKCFDDRGFSVDCATWTGYYHTWGGAGHPHAGGPGDGGSGSGSGNRKPNAGMSLSGPKNGLQTLMGPFVSFFATVFFLVFC